MAHGCLGQHVLVLKLALNYTQSLCDSVRLVSLFDALYHFGFLLLESTETLPPAHNPTLSLHQVSADIMETLLLLSGPVHVER